MYGKFPNSDDRLAPPPKVLARVLRSLGTVFCVGFMRAARNLGGRPYRRMLSTKRRTAHTWIQALNACATGGARIVENQQSIFPGEKLISAVNHRRFA